MSAENPMRQVIEELKEKGLPSEGQMRADVEAGERLSAQKQFDEYRALFERWKGGEDLKPEELGHMAELSDQLEEIVRRMQHGY